MKFFSRNLRNYITALAVLVICAAVYSETEKRLLSVPDVAEVTPRPPTQNVSAIQGLVGLFPEGAWQLGDCKRLLTSQGTLLFKTWQPISEDRWKLEPLTLVIGRGLSTDHSEAPIVLNAIEGAEVQFAESLDMMGGTAPPIKMGRMIGDVFIERAGIKEPSETFAVQTRNVRIDNQKVWTTERIAMQVAGADLRGIDLTIYLAASAASATKAEKPSTILDRMDLVYLEELRIPLDGTPSAVPTPRRIGTAAARDATQKENGVVSIKCKNGLGYDFALDRLSLRDSISMIRSVRGRVVDEFTCDTLDLVLRDPADRTVVRRGPLDWIDRINATGRPALMNLASYDFQLHAESIEFDSVGGLLNAKGSTGVRIKRGPIDAKLDGLTYQYNPDAPKQLGDIDVVGAGTVSVEQPGVMLRQLSWTESFKLTPAGQVTLDAVKEKREHNKLQLLVDGDVRATLADGGTANAGSVQGIMKPFYVDQIVQSPFDSTVAGRVVEPQQRIERKMTLVPEVFHALDGVSIDTNQIAAQMDRLSLFFEVAADYGKSPVSKSNSDGMSNVTNVTNATDNQQPGGLASFVSQPKVGNQLRAPVAHQPAGPSPRPRLSGDAVSAQLLISASGMHPKDVSIDGNVHLDHQVLTGESWLPIQMTGDTMRLLRSAVPQSSGQDYLQLGSGPEAPARLKMGDGFFVGPTIKVWPSDNVVQVTGAGELRVPSELLKRAPQPDTKPIEPTSASVAVSDVEWTSPPYCRWGGAMQFDGKTALLSGGVQIDAELVNDDSPWIASMTGQEMQIALEQPVSLMDQSSMSSAKLSEISLVQSESRPVMVRAEQRSVDQMTEAIHMIAASRFVFSPANGGALMGAGPGWYRGWMMMDENSSIVSDHQPETQTRTSQVLQGVHLTFRESMQGDLEKQTLAFTGGVRTGVRKLQSWNDAVDVTQMERLAVGELTLDCQQLQFGITPGMPEDLRRIPGMPTPWEMVAEGGVVVRTNTEKRGLIEGTAARASYESKKSWLNVLGAPGQSAFIRQTWPDGTAGVQAHSPRMLLNTKTYDFQTIMQDAQINNVRLPGKK